MRKAWTIGALLDGDATLLRRVVREVGAEEAASRLATYCEQANPDYASVRQFVAKHAHYTSQGRIAVDENGVLNAVGVAALNGGHA